MQQMTAGVAYLHSRGVVHRDLKPANALLCWESPINRRHVDAAARSGHSRSGEVGGQSLGARGPSATQQRRAQQLQKATEYELQWQQHSASEGCSQCHNHNLGNGGHQDAGCCDYKCCAKCADFHSIIKSTIGSNKSNANNNCDASSNSESASDSDNGNSGNANSISNSHKSGNPYARRATYAGRHQSPPTYSPPSLATVLGLPSRKRFQASLLNAFGEVATAAIAAAKSAAYAAAEAAIEANVAEANVAAANDATNNMSAAAPGSVVSAVAAALTARRLRRDGLTPRSRRSGGLMPGSGLAFVTDEMITHATKSFVSAQYQHKQENDEQQQQKMLQQKQDWSRNTVVADGVKNQPIVSSKKNDAAAAAAAAAATKAETLAAAAAIAAAEADDAARAVAAAVAWEPPSLVVKLCDFGMAFDYNNYFLPQYGGDAGSVMRAATEAYHKTLTSPAKATAAAAAAAEAASAAASLTLGASNGTDSANSAAHATIDWHSAAVRRRLEKFDYCEEDNLNVPAAPRYKVKPRQFHPNVDDTYLPKGTPIYMSPEAFMFNLPPQPGYDVWALGCIAYEFIYGSPAFLGASMIDARLNVQTTRIRYPRYLLAKQYPWEAREIAIAKSFMRRCLDRDPRTRATAEELLRHPWLAQERAPPPAEQGTATAQNEKQRRFDCRGVYNEMLQIMTARHVKAQAELDALPAAAAGEADMAAENTAKVAAEAAAAPIALKAVGASTALAREEAAFAAQIGLRGFTNMSGVENNDNKSCITGNANTHVHSTSVVGNSRSRVRDSDNAYGHFAGSNERKDIDGSQSDKNDYDDGCSSMSSDMSSAFTYLYNASTNNTSKANSNAATTKKSHAGDLVIDMDNTYLNPHNNKSSQNSLTSTSSRHSRLKHKNNKASNNSSYNSANFTRTAVHPDIAVDAAVETTGTATGVVFTAISASDRSGHGDTDNTATTAPPHVTGDGLAINSSNSNISDTSATLQSPSHADNTAAITRSYMTPHAARQTADALTITALTNAAGASRQRSAVLAPSSARLVLAAAWSGATTARSVTVTATETAIATQVTPPVATALGAAAVDTEVNASKPVSIASALLSKRVSLAAEACAAAEALAATRNGHGGSLFGHSWLLQSGLVLHANKAAAEAKAEDYSAVLHSMRRSIVAIADNNAAGKSDNGGGALANDGGNTCFATICDAKLLHNTKNMSNVVAFPVVDFFSPAFVAGLGTSATLQRMATAYSRVAVAKTVTRTSIGGNTNNGFNGDSLSSGIDLGKNTSPCGGPYDAGVNSNNAATAAATAAKLAMAQAAVAATVADKAVAAATDASSKTLLLDIVKLATNGAYDAATDIALSETNIDELTDIDTLTTLAQSLPPRALIALGRGTLLDLLLLSKQLEHRQIKAQQHDAERRKQDMNTNTLTAMHCSTSTMCGLTSAHRRGLLCLLQVLLPALATVAAAPPLPPLAQSLPQSPLSPRAATAEAARLRETERRAREAAAAAAVVADAVVVAAREARLNATVFLHEFDTSSGSNTNAINATKREDAGKAEDASKRKMSASMRVSVSASVSVKVNDASGRAEGDRRCTCAVCGVRASLAAHDVEYLQFRLKLIKTFPSHPQQNLRPSFGRVGTNSAALSPLTAPLILAVSALSAAVTAGTVAVAHANANLSASDECKCIGCKFPAAVNYKGCLRGNQPFSGVTVSKDVCAHAVFADSTDTNEESKNTTTSVHAHINSHLSANNSSSFSSSTRGVAACSCLQCICISVVMTAAAAAAATGTVPAAVPTATALFQKIQLRRLSSHVEPQPNFGDASLAASVLALLLKQEMTLNAKVSVVLKKQQLRQKQQHQQQKHGAQQQQNRHLPGHNRFINGISSGSNSTSSSGSNANDNKSASAVPGRAVSVVMEVKPALSWSLLALPHVLTATLARSCILLSEKANATLAMQKGLQSAYSESCVLGTVILLRALLSQSLFQAHRFTVPATLTALTAGVQIAANAHVAQTPRIVVVDTDPRNVTRTKTVTAYNDKHFNNLTNNVNTSTVDIHAVASTAAAAVAAANAKSKLLALPLWALSSVSLTAGDTIPITQNKSCTLERTSTTEAVRIVHACVGGHVSAQSDSTVPSLLDLCLALLQQRPEQQQQPKQQRDHGVSTCMTAISAVSSDIVQSLLSVTGGKQPFDPIFTQQSSHSRSSSCSQSVAAHSQRVFELLSQQVKGLLTAPCTTVSVYSPEVACGQNVFSVASAPQLSPAVTVTDMIKTGLAAVALFYHNNNACTSLHSLKSIRSSFSIEVNASGYFDLNTSAAIAAATPDIPSSDSRGHSDIRSHSGINNHSDINKNGAAPFNTGVVGGFVCAPDALAAAVALTVTRLTDTAVSVATVAARATAAEAAAVTASVAETAPMSARRRGHANAGVVAQSAPQRQAQALFKMRAQRQLERALQE